MGPLLTLAVSNTLVTGLFVLAVLAGIVGTYGVLHVLGKAKRAAAEREAQHVLEQARSEASRIVKQAEVDAKAEFIRRTEQFERDTAQTRNELRQIERRLSKREDNLEKKLDTLATKERSLELSDRQLRERAKAVEAKDKQLGETLAQQRAQLLRIAGMSQEEARATLLSKLEAELEQEAAGLIERRITEARETAEKKAREIIVTAIQRYAAEHTCDSTISTVDIPSDDMKGRVIGREGRNIRAFEKATGVDVIVDDTPGVVV
ncbi:MAG: Rnase Y domain-containing protein, partial [Phycisphaerae bacterium]